MVDLPPNINSVWVDAVGRRSVVIGIANQNATQLGLPVTVVYVNQDGSLGARSLATWRKVMRLFSEENNS